MPKRLLARCAPDSVLEFRLAAQQRFQDGCTLAASGRRTGAIYLWGYAAEMILKAAYFSAIGFPLAQSITRADLRGAAASAPALGVAWPGPNQFHNLRAWAELLVATRAVLPGLAYPAAAFGNQVEICGRRLQQVWSEVLRYHKNQAYGYESEQIRASVSWLLLHIHSL